MDISSVQIQAIKVRGHNVDRVEMEKFKHYF